MEARAWLDLELTMFYQGLESGTGSQDYEFGSRLDGFVKLDTGKMGLWKGGGLVSHLEYRTGDLAGSLGGTFFPTNSGMEFPSDSPDELVATSLFLSQRFGERTSLMLADRALDLLENDFFFGGWGNHRFMNAVFAAPPSGLVPPVFIGGIASYRLESASVSLWVYDPMDRTDDYLPGDLFDEGVTFYLTPSWQTKMAGRPTTLALTGIYTTKSGVDFSSLSESYQQGLEPSTKEGSYSVGFQFSHLLHVDPANPRKGWGLALKGAISDGNPNYVQSSIIAGLGGTGLFRGRELDGFGVGYFYYDLSDDLQDELTPVGDRLGDEQGVEAYYSFAVTPWFFVTGTSSTSTRPASHSRTHSSPECARTSGSRWARPGSMSRCRSARAWCTGPGIRPCTSSVSRTCRAGTRRTSPGWISARTRARTSMRRGITSRMARASTRCPSMPRSAPRA
jgi:porin